MEWPLTAVEEGAEFRLEGAEFRFEEAEFNALALVLLALLLLLLLLFSKTGEMVARPTLAPPTTTGT